MIEKLSKQKEQVKEQVHYTISQKENAIIGQLKEVIGIQEDIVNVKIIRHTIEEKLWPRSVIGKNLFIYSLKKVGKKL